MWQPGITLAQLEKNAIMDALKFYGGNKEQTANALGVSFKTIYNKLEVYQSDAVAEGEKEQLRKEEHRKQLDSMRGMNAKSETNGAKAEQGSHIQPLTKTPEKSGLSMRERDKVQKVSSR